MDTNVLLAAADEADPDHARCVALVEEHPGPLVTTALVVAETGWLIERQLSAAAEAGFHRSIAAGDLIVETLNTAQWERVAELVDNYSDLGLGGVDASLVVLADIRAHGVDGPRANTPSDLHFARAGSGANCLRSAL